MAFSKLTPTSGAATVIVTGTVLVISSVVALTVNVPSIVPIVAVLFGVVNELLSNHVKNAEAFASGERCTAIAEGDCSSAMIQDASSRNCLAVAKGRHSRIGGCSGTWLLFLNEDKPLYACVGTDGIRPDTYYTLTNGKIEKTS